MLLQPLKTVLVACVFGVTANGAALRQTPEDVAVQIAEELTNDALPDLKHALQESARKATKKLKANFHAGMQIVDEGRNLQVAATVEKVKAERKRETDIIAELRQGLNKAEQEAWPKVKSSAEEFAQNVANADILTAEQDALQDLVKSNDFAEKTRQIATADVLSVANVAQKAQELARNAGEFTESLQAANPHKHSADLESNFKFAKEQVENTLKLAKLARGSLKKAKSVASEALRASIVAEKRSQQALTTARSNTMRIRNLKLRAQAVFQKANALSFSQRGRQR